MKVGDIIHLDDSDINTVITHCKNGKLYCIDFTLMKGFYLKEIDILRVGIIVELSQYINSEMVSFLTSKVEQLISSNSFNNNIINFFNYRKIIKEDIIANQLNFILN